MIGRSQKKLEQQYLEEEYYWGEVVNSWVYWVDHDYAYDLYVGKK